MRVCVQIQVESTNTGALRLYARLGYRVVNMDTRATKLVGDVLFGQSVTITKLTLEKRLAPAENNNVAADWLKQATNQEGDAFQAAEEGDRPPSDLLR